MEFDKVSMGGCQELRPYLLAHSEKRYCDYITIVRVGSGAKLHHGLIYEILLVLRKE